MNDLTRALLADTRNIARDRIERIFEERVAALKAGVEQAVAESLTRTRRELTRKLNQFARRLQTSENLEQRSKMLVDATAGFCGRAAVFEVRRSILRLQAARNLTGELNEIALDSAAAFKTAVDSQDTVVALRTAGEMSETLRDWAGQQEDARFHLFPIHGRERVTALLYADSVEGEVDTNGLELLAMLAAAVIARPAPAAESEPALVNIQAPPPRPQQDQGLHLAAQRFARNRAAEIRLYQSENLKNARTARTLYSSFKEEIDSARETFRRDFLSSSGTMVDYLHLELVRTLANDDVELLGPEYPGPLL